MSCENSKESIISCPDAITLQMGVEIEIKDEVENLMLRCRKFFIIILEKLFSLIWLKCRSVMLSLFHDGMSKRKDHLSHQ